MARTIGSPRSLRVLRHRDARLVIIGNVISSLGLWSQYVGIGWAASELSDSTVVVGVSFAAQWAPSLLLMPFAGVLADRYDRRAQVIIGNVAMAVPPFVIGLLLQTGHASVAVFLLLVLVGGVLQSLTLPASQALVPTLVPDDEVQQAIALNSSLSSAMRIIGPGVGGLAIHAWGVGWAFHLNAISFFAVVAAWLAVEVRSAPFVHQSEPFVARLRAGVEYARANPAVGRLLVLCAVAGLFIMHAPLLPVFAREVLDGDEGTYAVLAAAPGLGAVIGAFLAGEILDGRARRLAVATGAVGMGVTLLAFSASRSLPVAATFLVVHGAANFLLLTLATTIVTAVTDDAYRGRVLGLLMTANIGFVPVNAVLAGVLGSAFGPAWTVAGAGAGFTAYSLMLVLSGRLRSIESTGHERARDVIDDRTTTGRANTVPLIDSSGGSA